MTLSRLHHVRRILLVAAVSLALTAGVSLTARADAVPPAAEVAAAQIDLVSSHRGAPVDTGQQARRAASDHRFASQDAFPVLLILGLVARLGIKWVIKWYGKTQIKKAAKSYLLNSVSRSKWAHIMQPKHKWRSVGAKSKEQVAELMARAMAEGSHSSYGSGARQAVWRYKGKTIVVTYAKNGGKISNGWVR